MLLSSSGLPRSMLNLAARELSTDLAVEHGSAVIVPWQTTTDKNSSKEQKPGRPFSARSRLIIVGDQRAMLNDHVRLCENEEVMLEYITADQHTLGCILGASPCLSFVCEVPRPTAASRTLAGRNGCVGAGLPRGGKANGCEAECEGSGDACRQRESDPTLGGHHTKSGTLS